MTTSRRDLLTAALTAAGAVAVPDLTNAQHSAIMTMTMVTIMIIRLFLRIPRWRVKRSSHFWWAKGLIDRAAVDALIDTYEHKIGPRNGARVVARAWSDPDYKRRPVDGRDAALAELGYGGLQGEHMVVVENTAEVHNLVSALCARVIHGPSSSAARLVQICALPLEIGHRPPRRAAANSGWRLARTSKCGCGTVRRSCAIWCFGKAAGSESLDEEALAALVTRDAMIGVAKIASPAQGGPA